MDELSFAQEEALLDWEYAKSAYARQFNIVGEMQARGASKKELQPELLELDRRAGKMQEAEAAWYAIKD